MSSKQLQLPAGYRQLETQVAGHTFEAANLSSIGLLQDVEAGYVLKPLGKPDCGKRELNFYQSLQAAVATGDSLLKEAYKFVPKFYQKISLIINNREHMFIKLEDLTYGMVKPCVMDIKIGKRTWDPLASPHKRAVEEQKYYNCKEKLGLCLPGFQVYEQFSTPKNKQIFIRHGKDYGKGLDAFGFRDTIALFCNVDRSASPRCPATTDFIREVLRQLYNIYDWFKRQKILHFYASSILITYDFLQLQHAKENLTYIQKPQNQSSTVNGTKGVSADVVSNYSKTNKSIPESIWVKVRMIDFAHVFPNETNEVDSNYIFGLENLISIIEELLCG